jgi:hypothetical protein
MFYWNEKFDYALMDILKNTMIYHWSMLCHCLTLLAIEILYIKKQIRNCIQYLQIFLKNNTNGHVNEILFNPFTSIPLTKFLEIPKFK